MPSLQKFLVFLLPLIVLSACKIGEAPELVAPVGEYHVSKVEVSAREGGKKTERFARSVKHNVRKEL